MKSDCRGLEPEGVSDDIMLTFFFVFSFWNDVIKLFLLASWDWREWHSYFWFSAVFVSNQNPGTDRTVGTEIDRERNDHELKPYDSS